LRRVITRNGTAEGAVPVQAVDVPPPVPAVALVVPPVLPPLPPAAVVPVPPLAIAAALPPLAELPPPAPGLTVVPPVVPALAPLPSEGVPVIVLVHPASTAAKQAPTRRPETLVRASVIRFSPSVGTRLVGVLSVATRSEFPLGRIKVQVGEEKPY
jgi:hypothetical protein